MFEVRYKDLQLIPSKAASEEMLKYGFMLADCKEILENGYDAPRKRASDTEEKWLGRGHKIYNVVVVRSFNFLYNEEVWLIIHVGRFTKFVRG